MATNGLTDAVAAQVMGELHHLVQHIDRQIVAVERAANSVSSFTAKALADVAAQAVAMRKANLADTKVAEQVAVLERSAKIVGDAGRAIKADMLTTVSQAREASAAAIEAGKASAINAAADAIAQAATTKRVQAVALTAGIAVILGIGAVAASFTVGLRAGEARGFAEARDQAAAVAWGASADGRLAYGLAQADSDAIRRLALCEGQGWKRIKGICTPQVADDNRIHGWKIAEKQ